MAANSNQEQKRLAISFFAIIIPLFVTVFGGIWYLSSILERHTVLIEQSNKQNTEKIQDVFKYIELSKQYTTIEFSALKEKCTNFDDKTNEIDIKIKRIEQQLEKIESKMNQTSMK